jgi:SAM-dependent methyltransferase
VNRIKRLAAKGVRMYNYAVADKGYCPICERNVRFIKTGSWLRDNYRCSSCNSIPRYRALIDAVKRFYPDFKNLAIHESSPNKGASSAFLRTKSKNYSSSQYFEDVPRGEYKDGFRSEDLTALTFKDASFDLIITQDVFEHVMMPGKAFSEIARVLKPGGAHIFSMPWYPELEKTRQRATVENNVVTHLEKPVYHGNPVNKEKGSLVTFDWGQDFVDFICKASGMYTLVYLQRDVSKGLDGEFLEIFISRKPG